MRGGFGRRLRAGGVLLLAGAATLAIYKFAIREDESAGPEEAATTSAEIPEPVRELVASLTTEQKVDQLLLLGFAGTAPSTALIQEIRERELGGLLLRRENWLDSSQGTTLIDELQRAAESPGRIEPMIAAAQEGGDHRALLDLPPTERQLDLGDSASLQAARTWGLETGEALGAAGIDLNLAPLADVATIASPLGDRVFSDDPVLTARLTAAAVQGCGIAIACAVGHFPGLGAASANTDAGPATVGLDPATLAARDLEPFAAAIEAGAPAVVLSHAYYVAYDPVTPGSLTPEIVTGLLREELGFQGVAITDDLGTGAIKATHDVPDAAIEAVRAGADMVQIGNPDDQAGVRERLIVAATSGEIPADRLDEATGRVLELKRRLGLLPDEAAAG
jgi:beta-N-acetylhexosaminidase